MQINNSFQNFNILNSIKQIICKKNKCNKQSLTIEAASLNNATKHLTAPVAPII